MEREAKKLPILKRLGIDEYQNVSSLIDELQQLKENKKLGAFVCSRSVIQVEDEFPAKFYMKLECHQQQKTMINALRKGDLNNNHRSC